MKVVRTVILSLILVFLAFVIYRAAKGGRKIPASTIRAEYRDIESKLTIPGVIQPSKEIDIKSTISGVLESCWCRLEMKWWEDSHWHKYDM